GFLARFGDLVGINNTQVHQHVCQIIVFLSHDSSIHASFVWKVKKTTLENGDVNAEQTKCENPPNPKRPWGVNMPFATKSLQKSSAGLRSAGHRPGSAESPLLCAETVPGAPVLQRFLCATARMAPGFPDDGRWKVPGK